MQRNTHGGGSAIVTPSYPYPVFDVTNATKFESYAASVTLITGAAGFTDVAVVPSPILNLKGDKVGSHWRRNPVWGTAKKPAKTTAVTETATSADFSVYDPTNNLEHLFEGVSNEGRFIAKLTIDGESEIWGYIGGVSVSNDVYTFEVYQEAALTTQSWNGTLPSGGAVRKVEIYSNQSSLVVSGAGAAALTEEVPWDFTASEGKTVIDLLSTLTNGQYAVDYARGKVYYKKATTGTAVTLTYNTYGGSGGPTPDINLSELGGETLGDHGSAVIDHGVQPLLEGKTFDGSALPNTVTEGQAARQAGTLAGVTYVMPVNADGSITAIHAESAAVAGGEGGFAVLAEAEDPTSMAAVTEADYARLKTDLFGRLNVLKGAYDGGEDTAQDVQKIEIRGDGEVVVTADTQMSTTSGVLRSLTFSCNDAAPTAGSIIVYDNTAESGDILYSETFTTTAFRGYTVHLNIPYGTGLYIGFTTTNDVNVSVNHRDDT